ncbi:MAG: 1-deoxy-D-xylulose-5-phosphate reductoisomerase [Candidatus Eremiobacteraeota bacterium]|nr:1-deoxy-D-xylulose-5-phosphate reductoisomerase [Candidatus Eremiobacteraeota bacterium]
MGSTGSIGRQALDVVADHPGTFELSALAARRSVALLAQQANRFRPAVLAVGSREAAAEIGPLLSYRPEVIGVAEPGLTTAAVESGAAIVLAATDGMAALAAVSAALDRGLDVALANKELAVAAGEPLFALARRSGAAILPVDSEHNAVFQCLLGERRADIDSIVLTASGGPFWDRTQAEMERATVADALRHPTWQMGPKNTLDSATMMNKGLEVIEASRFFELEGARIKIVVHRQSLVHAFVVLRDGNVKAQLALPDMRLPIAFALGYPDRIPINRDIGPTLRSLGVDAAQRLTFDAVDLVRFPAVALAYRALGRGGTFPAVLSAANEQAGRAFLRGKVKFTDIAVLIERVLDAHDGRAATLSHILEADRWARSATDDASTSITKS